MQVDLIDRHLMDGGLGLREPLKHGSRARAAPWRQARSVDQAEDFGEASMRMPMGRSGSVRSVIVIVIVDGVVGVLVHRELRRGDTGAEHARGVHVGVAKRQTAERLRQLVDRQAGIEQRAKRHIARNSREAIEIQDTTHGRRDSLKLKYRTSPRTT